MSTRLSPAGVPGPFPQFLVSSAGSIDSIAATGGTGQAVTADASVVEVPPSGGWFNLRYEQELRRREAVRRKQRELDEEVAAIPQPIDREIGLLLREQEAKDLKRQELERLRELATSLDAERARQDYGDRVSKALERAVQKGNYSALEALDREIQRAQEDEEQVALAVMMLIDDE